MVYLFGGAFLLGASNEVEILGDSLYDGREMADRGDVIIVTVNYRVGTMGFLSTGDARLPGLTKTPTRLFFSLLMTDCLETVSTRCSCSSNLKGQGLGPAGDFPACMWSELCAVLSSADKPWLLAQLGFRDLHSLRNLSVEGLLFISL